MTTNYPPQRRLPKNVKKTTGKTFDPNANWQYFLASDPEMIYMSQNDHVLVAVNELTSQKDFDLLKKMFDEGRKVMLDSGIFNLAMNHVRAHDVTHDEGLAMPPEEIDGFEQLWDKYANIVTTYGEQFWGVVELDQGGAEHKPRTRARIENELGITPIPVYHPLLDGWDYYDELASEYDRLCFGNIVQAASSVRLKLAHTAMERAKDYPYLWTHLLGLSMSGPVLGVRMRGSMDSSSWLACVRWQNNWAGSAMGVNISRYDPDMFAHKASYFDGPDLFDSQKGRLLPNMVARSQQEILGAVLDDTHSDYDGR